MLTRRHVLALPFAAVAAGYLTSCSSTDSPNPGSGGGGGAVTLWMYPVIADAAKNQSYWDGIATSFDEQNSGYDLTVQLQSFEKRDEQVATAIAAGQGPDVVLLTPDQVATFHAIDGLLPVDDAIADDRDAFYPRALESVTFDGGLYGIPMFNNICATGYNTALLEAAGISELPATWADVLAAAPAVASTGKVIFDYGADPATTLNATFYPLLWQADGRVFTEDGSDVAFDSAEGVAALQFLLDLQAAGGLPADVATKREEWMTGGKAAIRHQVALQDSTKFADVLGDAFVIGAPLTGAVQATYGNPGMLALTAINSDDNREAAYLFLRWMTSAQQQGDFVQAAERMPTRTDVEPPTGNDAMPVMEAALEVANPGEVHPQARPVMSVIAPQLQLALQGKASAEDALGAAAEEARALLARS